MTVATRTQSLSRTILVLLGIGGLLISLSLTLALRTTAALWKIPANIAFTVVAPGMYDSRFSKDKDFPALVLNRCSVLKDHISVLNVKMVAQRYVTSEQPVGSDYLTLHAAQMAIATEVKYPNGRIEKIGLTDNKFKCFKQGKLDNGQIVSVADTTTISRRTALPIQDGTKLSNGKVALQQSFKSAEAKPYSLLNRNGFTYQFGPKLDKKKQYYYYDIVVRKAVKAKFMGEKKFGKYNTYHFLMDFPEVDTSTLLDGDLAIEPGSIVAKEASWWGVKASGIAPSDTITMRKYFKEQIEAWVEPQSGVIIFGRNDYYQYFRVPAPSKSAAAKDPKSLAVYESIKHVKIPAFRTIFAFDNKTVQAALDLVDTNLVQFNLINKIIPLISGTLGILAVIAGGVLTLRNKKS